MKKAITILFSTAIALNSAAALAKTDAGNDINSSVRFPSCVHTYADWYSKYCFNGMFVIPGCDTEQEAPDCTPDTEIPEINIPEIEAPEVNIPEIEAPEQGTPEQEAPEQEAPEQEAPDQGTETSFEKQVLDLVNEQRAQNGLSALVWDDALASVARAHSEDMRDRHFFSHTNPDGLSPFDRIKSYGISYRSAGENIAAGQTTPAEVVQAWMNSSGHRANILNEGYTKLGVGYASGGSYGHYWTQNFAS